MVSFHDRISNARELSSSTGSQKLTNVSLKDPSDPLPLTLSLFLSVFVISLFSNNRIPFPAIIHSRPRVIRVIREIRMKSFIPSQRVLPRITSSFNLHASTDERSIISFSTQFAGITFVQCLSMSIDYKSEGTIISCFFFLFLSWINSNQFDVATKRHVRGTSLVIFLAFFFGTREKCLLLNLLRSLKIFLGTKKRWRNYYYIILDFSFRFCTKIFLHYTFFFFCKPNKKINKVFHRLY